jgi:hypothetical protein
VTRIHSCILRLSQITNCSVIILNIVMKYHFNFACSWKCVYRWRVVQCPLGARALHSSSHVVGNYSPLLHVSMQMLESRLNVRIFLHIYVLRLLFRVFKVNTIYRSNGVENADSVMFIVGSVGRNLIFASKYSTVSYVTEGTALSFL